MPTRRLSAVVAVIALAVVAAGGRSVLADSYENDAYRAHDIDNVGRSSGRQRDQLTLEYIQKMQSASSETHISNVGTQVADLPRGRVYAGLGQLLPGGSVGDAREFHELKTIEVNFLTRTGAKLNGRLFWDGEPGPHPLITITSGSIQGPQSGYWWAGQLLADNGYIAFTWDTQGQGESEAFGHAPGDATPTLDGFPSQQAPNFVDSTVDAIRFVLSTPDSPYRPEGWSEAAAANAAAAADAAGEAIDWVNPLHATSDRNNLGLAGHSLGASAVSIVAQCSDQSDRWQSVDACPKSGPLPIRAVVGWDSLSAGDDVRPVVPGMNQQGDGYFLNPQPSFDAPNPDSHLGTHQRYVDAGVDTFSYSVRGGTHLEWSYIPVILPATSYGIVQAGYYTLAWFDRYVFPAAARQAQGSTALVNGPIPDNATAGTSEFPWRANFLSARYRSAARFHTTEALLVESGDLRSYGGLSPVGDWQGANADNPSPRT